MRNNGPVTQVDHPLSSDDVLISKTDSRSYITYANPSFVEISGFNYEELVGSPHNIVRHPDMPEAVFEDMWKTLGSSKSWSGLVKNRRKNGDHYWVRANAVPLSEGGRVQGYASIRVKPSEEEVRKAEEVYRDMREGGGRYVIQEGQWYRRGLLGKLGRINPHSLGVRIGGVSALTFLLLGITGIGGGYMLHQQGQDAQRLTSLAGAHELEANVAEAQRLLATSLIAGEQGRPLTGDLSARVDNITLAIREAWPEVEEGLGDVVGNSEAVGERINAFIEGPLQTISQNIEAGRLEQASTAFATFVLEDSPRLFTELRQLETTLGQHTAEAALALPMERWLGAIFAAIALLGGVIVALLGARIAAYVRRSLGSANSFALQVAAGNLKTEMPKAGRDEVGQTLQSLNFMRKSLTFLIGEINQRVGVVRPSVNELLDSNNAMASRIEQQASAVQQTAASTEEISTTVAHSAENARLASQASTGNLEEVDQANEVMRQLTASMQEITRQAENMASIVGTIDSIAFQTNILALNASVEAARADEHGRGFSVVAQEVRKLASQSAEAAQQVQKLIERARDGVCEGEKHTHDAEHAMERIRVASQRVNDLMGEISAASEEQSDGITQISQAITQIDQGTQESSVAMHTYNRSTESLQREVHVLSHSAQAFLSEAEVRAIREDSSPARQATLRETFIPASLPAPTGPGNTLKARAEVVHEDEWETF